MARLAIAPEERKKLYVLGGLLAAITLVVVVLYIPRGGSSTTPVTPPITTGTPPVKNPSGPPGSTPTPGGAPTPGAGAGGLPGGAVPGGASASGGSGSGGISAASLVPVSTYRDDPFKQVSLPPPLPTPPPPPGPVILEQPSVVLSPPGSESYSGLPPFGVPSGGNTTPSSRILTQLPPPRISRVADAPTAPSLVQLPGSESGGSVSRSPGKRLAGVVIGDSVRALLEIDSGDAQTPPTTRIVQPGDDVDGIRILRIERVSEGGRTVTRMFVRENDEERFIDLRPAPQQTGTGQAGTAPGGIGPRGPRTTGAP